MKRKLLVALAPLVAVAALLAAPVAAQAEPHWYFNSNILVKKKATKTEGGLKIGPIPGTTIIVECKLKDVDVLINPASGGAGEDVMKAFKLTECAGNPCPVNSAGVQGGLKIKALNLPWKTRLVEVPPIADEIAGVELEFFCKKFGPLMTLTGTLSPWVNNLGFLEFTAATGTLSGVNVIGFDNFLPATVEAYNP